MSKANSRVASRIAGIFGKTIDPCVLEMELLRDHPEIQDLDTIPVNQLDVMLTITGNKILTGSVISGREIFEDTILPNIPQRVFTDADAAKSITGRRSISYNGVLLRPIEKDRFYADGEVRLNKSASMSLFDQYQQTAEKVAKKRAIISKKRQLVQQEIEKLPREWNIGQEELEALEGKIKEQIDAWTAQMDSVLKQMLNRSKNIESIGDLISKYTQFKQAMKCAVNQIKWQAMDDARDKLAAEKPVKALAKSMGAMRNLAKHQTRNEMFDHFVLLQAEKNIVGYFDEVA
jgi:HAMP domain-containing protein